MLVSGFGGLARPTEELREGCKGSSGHCEIDNPVNLCISLIAASRYEGNVKEVVQTVRWVFFNDGSLFMVSGVRDNSNSKSDFLHIESCRECSL